MAIIQLGGEADEPYLGSTALQEVFEGNKRTKVKGVAEERHWITYCMANRFGLRKRAQI